MKRKSYTRDDVTTHAENFGERRPAVNVKVHRSIDDVTLPSPDYDARLTHEWIAEHVSDDRLNWLFWHTCETEWEQLQQDADDIFGPGVTIVREGRSGGWAVAEGLPDLETWDAIMLGKWRRFERFARGIAHDIPEQRLGSLECNEFDAWLDEEEDASPQNAEVPIDLAIGGGAPSRFPIINRRYQAALETLGA